MAGIPYAGNPYAGARVVRRFFVSPRSSQSVQRLEGGVIRKTYNPGDERHRQRFRHEVEILTRLKGCSFVPQLLHVDMEKAELYMSDCGQSLENLPFYRRGVYRAKIRKLMIELLEKYGLYRLSKDRKKLDLVVSMRNATLHGGRIKIIDMNGDRYTLHPTPEIAKQAADLGLKSKRVEHQTVYQRYTKM